jgi:hypothetical protein
MANNTVQALIPINGLFKRLNYTFEIEGLGGNWPARVSPASGEFTAVGKSGNISASVSFCATTGSCLGDTDILPYDMAKKCTFDKSQVFTYVRIKATLVDDPTISVYSDPINITCNTCLPNAAIQLPPAINLDRSSKNIYDFIANVSGLVPKENYTFIYSAVDSNWPIKIYPISGTIYSTTDSYSIPTEILFCNNTGVCPGSSDNVLSYELDPACLNHSYFGSIKLDIQPDSCQFDNAESNIMHVHCDDCFPKPLAGMPSRIELTSATNNYAEFTTIVSGIIPDKKYSFSFRSLDSNWPVLLENTTGLFSSPTDTYCIDSSIKFCEHTGVCLTGMKNVLHHTIPSNCTLEPNDYEARIIVDIKSVDCGDTEVSSNIMNFNCTDCFPPSVEMSFSKNPINIPKDELYEFVTSFSNLEPNKVYYYSFQPIFSNWPVFVDSASGYIQSPLSYYDLVSSISFCASTGLCPTGYNNVLNYTPDNGNNIVDRYVDNNRTYAILKTVLTEADCPAKSYTSNRLLLGCNDCQIGGSISLVSVDIT